MARLKRDKGKPEMLATDTKQNADAGRSETLARDGKTKADADAIVKEQCIVPLRKAAGQEVPTIAISSEFVRNRNPDLKINKYCSSERIRVYCLESGEDHTGSRP